MKVNWKALKYFYIVMMIGGGIISAITDHSMLPGVIGAFCVVTFFFLAALFSEWIKK